MFTDPHFECDKVDLSIGYRDIILLCEKYFASLVVGTSFYDVKNIFIQWM